jgi:hypothetical protein
MTRTIAVAREEATLPGRIIYLVGERQPDRLARLLGAYLSQPQVERVVLVTGTPATASRVAAPYAAQREEGRLATVLADDDVAGAMRAARRGWGEPDVLISTGSAAWPDHATLAPAPAVSAAD